MQHNFCSPLQFLQRTDALASVLACNLNDLPEKIGISERSLYGYRVGKYPVTAKALRKLEIAERTAGILAAIAENAESSANPKDPGIGIPAYAERDDSTTLREEHPLFTAKRGPDDLLSVLRRIANAQESIAAALEKLVETEQNKIP